MKKLVESWKKFLEDVIRERAGRNTVMAVDVVYALKRQGIPLYGFGGYYQSHQPQFKFKMAEEKVKIKIL